MKTARDRLEFAIRFAQLDLTNIRPGNLLNLRDDLEAFHGYGPTATTGASLSDLGGIMAAPISSPLPSEFTEDDFKKLQAEVKELLLQLAVGNSASKSHEPPGAGWAVMSTFPVSARYSVLPLHSSGQTGSWITAQGDTRDVTLLRLFHLLSNNGSAPLRLCPEPECGRLFYRVRRQEYCSKKCVNRANKRAARAKEKTSAKGSKTAPATAAAGKKPKRARGASLVELKRLR